MAHKDRWKRRSRIRDLDRAPRAKRRDASTHDPANGGLPRGAVVPGYRGDIEDTGRPLLLTRSGKRVDMRTGAGRRFIALIHDIIQDLGGAENVSTAEHQLIYNAAALSVDLEQQVAEWLRGERPLDRQVYRVMVTTQRQAFEALGLRRRARNVTPPDPLKYAQAIEDADYREVDDE